MLNPSSIKAAAILSLASASLVILSGCSAFRAANHSGVHPAELSKCETAPCITALDGVELVLIEELDQGNLAYSWRVPSPYGNTGRAAGHFTASVLTLGLWEFAGGAIEDKKLDKTGFYGARAIVLDREDKRIVSIEFSGLVEN